MAQAVFNLEYRAYPAATLQWYIGSGPVEERFPLSDGPDYSGTTTKTLTILDVTEFMDGTSYSCKLTNAEGSVWSRLCLLTVNAPPDPGTSFDAPDFFRADFNVSSESDLEVDFGNPAHVGFVGTVDSEYIYRTIFPSNFHGEVNYSTGPEYSDTFNFDTYRIQGCGMALGSPGFGNSEWVAVTFYAKDEDGLNQNRFRIIDQNNNILYTSGLYDANTPYNCTVTIDITGIGEGAAYDLTIRLQVPELSIDESRTILGWTGFGSGEAKFVVNGPFYTDHVPVMTLFSYSYTHD